MSAPGDSEHVYRGARAGTGPEAARRSASGVAWSADCGSAGTARSFAPEAGRLAWVGVAGALALFALAGVFMPREAIDWQPGLALRQPWRVLSAVGVHYGPAHLGWNLAGLLLTGCLGWVAHPPGRVAVAWLAAWPATQCGLAIAPQLLHYGGLSGVLHAGVAVVATFLLLEGSRAQRAVAGAIALGLVAKIVVEAPWGPPLRHAAGAGFATAPPAHASGALFGLLFGAAAGALRGAGAAPDVRTLDPRKCLAPARRSNGSALRQPGPRAAASGSDGSILRSPKPLAGSSEPDGVDRPTYGRAAGPRDE